MASFKPRLVPRRRQTGRSPRSPIPLRGRSCRPANCICRSKRQAATVRARGAEIWSAIPPRSPPRPSPPPRLSPPGHSPPRPLPLPCPLRPLLSVLCVLHFVLLVLLLLTQLLLLPTQQLVLLTAARPAPSPPRPSHAKLVLLTLALLLTQLLLQAPRCARKRQGRRKKLAAAQAKSSGGLRCTRPSPPGHNLFSNGKHGGGVVAAR